MEEPMRAEKNGRAINGLADWQELAGPKKAEQWVEGRSAYELAYAWCGSGAVAMPPELRALLESHEKTRNLDVECVFPEHRIAFDSLPGEPRNADLAFTGVGVPGKIAVTMEAKADETFDGTVAETLEDALERLLKNPRSQGVRRVADLVRALFAPRARGQTTRILDLRYQLLTATAGTLAYARMHEASLAVLIVHEFVTARTRDELHEGNAADYRAFLQRLSADRALAIEQGGLLGPFAVPGVPLFEAAPPLLVGKVTTRRRPTAAPS
jgi:hypothetical protein